ncbi:MAG: hypothetical protein AAF841_03830 [Pseudomonadota bacterium]
MKSPKLQREVPLQEVFQIMIALGNRIDAYWQRYLYMNFVFTFSLVAGFDAIPLLVRIFLFMIFALVLTRTFLAMKDTYLGLQVCLKDLRMNRSKFEAFPALTRWTRRADFGNRRWEMLLAWLGSLACVGFLSLAPEIEMFTRLELDLASVFTWLRIDAPAYGPELPR